MPGRASKNKGYQGEREFANMANLERTPLSGSAGGNDMLAAPPGHPLFGFGIEVKRIARIPVFVTKAYDQAVRALSPTKGRKRALVAMREDRGQWLLVMSYNDLIAHLGGVSSEQARRGMGL